MKKMTIMSGAEALVRGAVESGVRTISGYPGYPITGIMDHTKAAKADDLHVEWAANEKVALETVLGTSIAGFRGMAVMKQVGVNVAADPLMSAVTWGTRGGVVIVAGDDPGCDGSPVEQDSRCYGYLANIPVLDPSTPEEGRRMVKAAFGASEKFGLPIILRFTKEYIAMKGEVEKGDITPGREVASKEMLAPFNGLWTESVKGHYLRHSKMDSMVAELAGFNTQEGNGSLGIVTSGYAVNLVQSALDQLGTREKFSILKLGVIPSPDAMIESFAHRMDRILVVEFGEPLIEQQVRMISKKLIWGKMSGHISYVGAIILDDLISVLGGFVKGLDSERRIPITPRYRRIVGKQYFGDMQGDPVMCPGCPGIGLHYSLKKLKGKYDLLTFCDNGCISHGALPPWKTLDYGTCMGGTTGAAHGACVAGKKAVALIGDSAFIHSGIGGLLSMVNNNSKATVVILDNISTAMSGRQPNPATGVTLKDRPSKRVMIEDLCRACGVEEVGVVDPYDLKKCQEALEKAITSDEISVLIARRACALLPEANYGRAEIDLTKCNLCMDCVEKMRCPAISLQGGIRIGEICNGCMICAQVCPEKAIYKIEEHPSKNKSKPPIKK